MGGGDEQHGDGVPEPAGHEAAAPAQGANVVGDLTTAAGGMTEIRAARVAASTPDRRSGRDRDWTDAESEGLPATEDQPPGIDAETAAEGMVLPADHPVGATERGVTPLEESLPESPADRSARERPDVPQAPSETPGGRLASGGSDDADDPSEGEWAPDHSGLSAEEAAIHIEEG